MRTSNVVTVIAVLALVFGTLAAGCTAPGAQQAQHGERAGQQGAQVSPAQQWAEMLEHLDADASGTISQDEFPGPDQVFAKIDLDGNGQITQKEAVAMHAGRGRGQGGPGHGEGPADPAERWARLLEHVDADGSGTISQDEFPGPDEAFAKIDADGNGQITQEEMQAAAQHRRQRGENGHRRGPGQGAPQA